MAKIKKEDQQYQMLARMYNGWSKFVIIHQTAHSKPVYLLCARFYSIHQRLTMTTNQVCPFPG